MSARNQISIPSLYAERRANPWDSAVSFVCACVHAHACRSICSEYIFMYHVSHLCHAVFLMLETLPDQLIVAILNPFSINVFVSHSLFFYFFLNKQTRHALQRCGAKCSPKILLFWICDTLNPGTWSASAIIVHHAKLNRSPNADLALSQSAIWFCRMASLCMPITVRISPYWLGAGIICVLFSIKEEIYHLWDIKAEPAALRWPVHWLLQHWMFTFLHLYYDGQTDRIDGWMDREVDR